MEYWSDRIVEFWYAGKIKNYGIANRICKMVNKGKN